MASPTDHLATVRAALTGLDGVAANRWVHAAADLCNAAPAIAALADECERLRKELDVAADCGIMRGRSWETTEWEAATGFRSKLEARRMLAAFRIACAEFDRRVSDTVTALLAATQEPTP